MRIGSSVLAGLALTIVVAGTAHAVEPLGALRGSMLTGPTHLRLIVADGPPFTLDVDRNTVRLVPGVASRADVVSVVPFAGGALVDVDRRSVVLGADGSKRHAHARAAARARKADAAWAARRGPGDGMTVVDRATWQTWQMRWPSILGWFDRVVAQPHGPFVAIGFADPAFPGPAQAEDLFLLNRRTGALTHVPGFPASMELKRSSMAWTSDDRLVLLFEVDGVTRIGVYRPGDRAVSLRQVTMPERNGSSDQFVPVVTGG